MNKQNLVKKIDASAAAGRTKRVGAARATTATPRRVMCFIMTTEDHAAPEPGLKRAFMQRCLDTRQRDSRLTRIWAIAPT